MTEQQIAPRPKSVVDIAIQRIQAFLAKGDQKYDLEPVNEDQATRIAALAVGLMMVDGLWLEAGSAKMNMEFPLRPDVTVTLNFKGRPIQSDVDLLLKVLQVLKETLPVGQDVGAEGFSHSFLKAEPPAT